MWLKVPYFTVAIVLAPPCALACKCALPVPANDGAAPLSRAVCNHLPDPSVDGEAVFVGIVTDIYPRSVEYLTQLWERLSGRKLSEEHPPTVTELKEVALLMWRESLNRSEITKLLAANSDEELDSVVDEAFGWGFPRRVRLKVMERFVGVAKAEFELFTGMGGGDCGVAFEAGKQYLVFASQDEYTGRWRTTICSGTREALDANEDIRTLRAWTVGQSLPPRIYGSVWDWTDRGNPEERGSMPLSNVEVRASAKGTDLATFTDGQGRFKFDDLKPGRYRVTLQLPGWRLWVEDRREIDLTTARCAELRFSAEQNSVR
jgi:hypothetical protein